MWKRKLEGLHSSGRDILMKRIGKRLNWHIRKIKKELINLKI